MALTEFQRSLCRLIAENRISSGESYVAGGVALNELTAGTRISRDVDLFHDTEQALDATWAADRVLLEQSGYEVRVLLERRGLVEAQVTRENDGVLLQWVRDSAFRFFPLVRHEDLGLTLHAFDLATNKVLALVGRLEPRDWVDVIHCHDRVQPLGYLVWAACGKDPGFSPASILEHAARANRHSADEIRALSFDGDTPDPARLSRSWHAMLAQAADLVAKLPAEQAGKCVLNAAGNLYISGVAELTEDLRRTGAVRFHPGSIRGVLPELAG